MADTSARCESCGYPMTGIGPERCPECGSVHPFRERSPAPPPFWSMKFRVEMLGIFSSLILLVFLGGGMAWLLSGRLSKSEFRLLNAGINAIGWLVIPNLFLAGGIAALAKTERAKRASTTGFFLALALFVGGAMAPALGES